MLDLTGAKVLVVDDTPRNIQVVGSILMKENYDIYVAKNGKLALKQVSKIDFDLILLDVMMPEMDGYEVCQKIKEELKKPDIPIIFLTAKNDSESVVKAFKLGAVDFITKPFNAEELLARVKNHLSLKFSKEEVVKKNHELLKANASKNKFFSIIAHDLRSPFSALVGLSKLLLDDFNDYDSDTVKEYIGIIHQSSNETLGLLENLLQWSRSQTNRINFSPEILSVPIILETIKNLFVNNLKKKEISLILQYEMEDKIFADKNMIDTVIRNFVSNALKFTPRGGEITISGENKGDKYELRVSDTGVGMTEDQMNKLFKIEESSSTKGTEDESGSGLGLILCKEFIEKNNGSVSVESEPGKGTTFVVTLPISEKS